MANWWRDVRFGLRMLARNKGFSAISILALALGIGANVAIFSIVWATMLAPLPYPHTNRIVMVWSHFKGRRVAFSADEFAEIAARSRSFEALQFGSWATMHLTNIDGSQAEQTGSVVSTGDVLEVPVALGRYFQPADGAPGRNHVVVIKHTLWVNRYHSDPNILGKSILIDNQPYAIIGVFAAGPEDKICCSSFSVPMQYLPGVRYGDFGQIDGRLKPGATLAQANAEVAAIDAQFRATQPGGNPHQEWTSSVEPLKDDFLAPDTIRNLWLLLAAVGLVLLIACADVANLLLSRGAARQQEIAMRLALGATRRQVFLQLLTESVALALIGGLAGIAVGWGVMRGAMAIVPKLTAEAVVGLNLPVLGFALAATLLSGVFFGCMPAWHASRFNLSEMLKQGSRGISGGGRFRTQGALVVTEFALALTLLAGAGMTMHSFWKLTTVDLGVRTDHILTAYLTPNGPVRRGPLRTFPTSEQLDVRYGQLLESFRSAPGVEYAAFATNLPLDGHDSMPFSIAGQATPAKNDKPVADLEAVTPGYFPAFRVQLLRGRNFTDADNLHSPAVVMASASFVRSFLLNRDPLRQQIMLPVPIPGQPLGSPIPHQIVGVFADVANGEHLGEKNTPALFVPFFQNPLLGAAVVLRTAIPPDAFTATLRQTMTKAAPAYSLNHVQSMDYIVKTQLVGNRFSMVLLGSFAGVALLLAALGIYGVMAFAVTRRTHEIGIRMALGAERHHVVALMVRSGMRLAIVGAAIGLAGVYVLGRILRSNLYGMAAIDLASLCAVAALLLLVAWLATWIPARRCARIDPLVALREE